MLQTILLKLDALLLLGPDLLIRLDVLDVLVAGKAVDRALGENGPVKEVCVSTLSQIRQKS